MHLSSHAQDTKYEFSCNSCDRSFFSQSSLWKHMKVHTREPYQCKVCSKRFTRKENLKLHRLRRHHFDTTQQLTSPSSKDADIPLKRELISDEEFMGEGNVIESFSDAEGSQQPAIVADEGQRVGRAEDGVTCEVCHNRFPGELIETHMRITYGDGTNQCPFCPRMCLHKADLKRHISTHDNNLTRSYSCDQCGFKFLAEAHFKRHLITKHSKNRKPELKCELCEKMFYTKVGLERHMRIHTGATVSCEVCGARFTQEQSLRKHMLRYTAKMKPLTPNPQTAINSSLQIKEELR